MNTLQTIAEPSSITGPVLRLSDPPPSVSDSPPPAPKQIVSNERRVGGYTLFGGSFEQGAFGKVYSGMHRLSGCRVAIKALDKHRLTNKTDISRITAEIQLHKQLSHRNCCRLLEVLDTGRHVYMVMEHCSGGELLDLIEESPGGFLPEERLRPLAHQLLSALSYMHSIGIVHRDVKTENILLDSTRTQIKLIDLGLAATARHGRLLRTACGSPFYASPQLLSGQKHYSGPPVDCWAAGVVLYAAATGVFPFSVEMTPGESERHALGRLYSFIRSGVYPEAPLSPLLNDLISGLLTVNENDRLTASRALDHPFFAGMSTNPVTTANNVVIADVPVGLPLTPAPPRTPTLSSSGNGSNPASQPSSQELVSAPSFDATALLLGLPLSTAAPVSGAISRPSTPPQQPKARKGLFKRHSCQPTATQSPPTAVIDDQVLLHASQLLRCTPEILARALNAGRHNQHTATYWLLKLKYEAAEIECAVYEASHLQSAPGEESMLAPTTPPPAPATPMPAHTNNTANTHAPDTCALPSFMSMTGQTAASPEFIFVPLASGHVTPMTATTASASSEPADNGACLVANVGLAGLL